jgi:uncharacterized protein YjbI with pentapeptide repeats
MERLEVTGGDWSFVGLPGAQLRKARFTGVRMRETDLAGADLQHGALLRCDLTAANWSRADLRKCDLRGSELSSLEPLNSQLGRAVIDWAQAATLAANLGLDVRPD